MADIDDETPRAICAVMNCSDDGERHVCPYDGASHGHGRVHYGEAGVPSKLTFRAGWHLVCAEHYQALCAEWRAYSQARALIRASGGEVC